MLFRFLRRKSWHFHLALAFGLGVVARFITAFYVFGPQALDDYKHGVLPAYELFAGLPSTLPDYRSYLLVWFLAGIIKFASYLGVASAVAQVRAMYLGLAWLSMLSVVGAYFFARAHFSRQAGALAMYLMALFPLMPFVGTRAFGESVALSFVVLGFGLSEWARVRQRLGVSSLWSDFFGFAMLGLATLFRFQCGLIFMAYALIRLFPWRLQSLVAPASAGVLTLGVQVLVDHLSGRGFLGTLVAYIKANEGGAAQYGVSPWYNTWAFVLALTLFPFSVVFLRQLQRLFKAQWRVLVPVVIFIAIHSLMPHKEERFMYPIVGMVLLALAQMWAWGRNERWVRRFYAPVFVAVTGLALPVLCLNNSQVGEIGPAAWVNQNYASALYLDRNSLFLVSRIKDYFLRAPSGLIDMGTQPATLDQVEQLLAGHPEVAVAAVLTSDPTLKDEVGALAGQMNSQIFCGSLRSASSWADSLLYRLNPKHNQRRRPTWYLVCERNKSG